MSAVSWAPSWPMVSTKRLELRKRRGLMITVVLFTVGLPVIVLGIRLIAHLIDPNSFGPAGSPSVFIGIIPPMAAFGFIVAATLGASAGTTDLTDGVFRYLVVTGRSRLSLYLARVPAGLSILWPLLAAGFAIVCLVTVYAGTSPTAVNYNGINIPANLTQPQLKSWLIAHPQEAQDTLGGGPFIKGGGPFGGGSVSVQAGTGPNVEALIEHHMNDIYSTYTAAQLQSLNPPINQMVKIGLWLLLELTIGFLVGLGFGSLVGQRTIAIIVMIVLELVITPIASGVVIPYFINGQRLIVGVAMDQLRPALLSAGTFGHGARIVGGRALGIPPMPTWAMIAVIVGWLVGWTAIGAWRMITRDT
jgi:hypothetical protein